MAESFGERLGRIMAEKGYNTSSFARAAGVSRETVRKHLADQHDATNAIVHKYAQVLGCSVGHLRDGTGSDPDLAARVAELEAQLEELRRCKSPALSGCGGTDEPAD